jgi:hypothetical protein
MSSGFQQDVNQLAPNFYRVQIDMANGTYFPTTDTGNHNDGGCTPNAWDFFALADAPSTQAHATSRARGNLRFKNVVRELTNLGDCQILDVTITEANADAQATALTFTVKYERDAFIPLTGTLQGTSTVGNDAAGNAMDTPAKAIANAIAFGLYTGRTETMRVYNPDAGEGQQLSVTANAATSLANILGKVTVTLIDTTTLVNS